MTSMIYAGQGPVIFGDVGLVAGRLENQYNIGCGVSTLKLSVSRETAEIKESCSGTRGTLVEYEKSKSIEVELELSGFDKRALAQAFYGTLGNIASGTVTAEAMPTMAAGDLFHTRHPKVSAVVVRDNSNNVLAAGTSYVVEDANFGRIKILNSAYAQPYKVDYAYAARQNLKIFQQAGVTKGLIFNGISTIDNSRVRLLLPRISFAPTSDFDFFSEDATPLKLSGKVLTADVSASDPVLGPYGVIDLL